MRNFINLVAFAALLFVPSLAMAQLSLPVTMDFENETAYNNWTVVNGATDWSGNPGTTRYNGEARNGSYCFRFYYSTNPPQYLISPELDPLMNPAQVEFWYKTQSDYYTESFQVGYSTTTTDASAFTWSTEVTTNATSYQKYEGYVPAGTKYVCIKYTANDQYFLFIDDIVIQDPPTCLPVTNLNATNITDDGLTLTWSDPMNNGANYSLSYWTNGVITRVTGISDTSYQLTGLNANTAYNFMVRAICADDDSSAAVTATFRTNCGPMSVPFFDNFDSYANGLFPPCWNRVKVHGTDPSVNNQYHASGTQSMFLLDHQDTNIFATPTAIPLAGNEIQVSYKAYIAMGDASTWIKAGVMTDLNDRSTFIMLDSIGFHDFNYEFEEHDFNTSSLDASESYFIVWMFYSNYSPYYSGRGAIDDVSITQLTGCVRPSTASVGTVGARQAELSWTSVPGANGYTVYYGTVNDPTSETLLTTSASDTAFTLTELNPETHYYVWVATNCGGSESDLRYVGNFTTLVSCPAVTGLTVDTTYADGATISWHPGDVETEWMVFLDDNDFELVSDTTYTAYGLDPMTGHTLYVRAYCGDDDTSSTQSINFATTCEDATCNLTFAMTDSYGDGWNGNSIQVYQVGVMVGQATISSGSSATETIEVCSSAAVELHFVSGSYAYEMGGTVTDGSGAIVFTIADMGNHNSGDVLATVSNPCPECIMPNGLSVSDITATEATISWVAQEDQTSWSVILDSNEAITVTDTFYTFTDLDARTLYTAHVATDCGDGLSNYASINFTTDCVNGSCDFSVTSTANYIYEVYCPTVHIWQNGEEVASVNAATQTVNVCSNMPLDIIYEEPTYNWGDNPTVIIIDGGGDQLFNSNTDAYSNGDTLIAISNACPNCISPTGLTVTDVDSTTINFAWDVADTVLGYLVSFDGSDYFFTTNGIDVYTGLIPNTEHTFSVRTLCTDTDTSNARTITVRTTCGPMAIPYVEDFENATAGSAPLCWNIVSGDPEVDNYAANAQSGSKSLVMNGNDMITTQLVPLAGDSIHVSFWAKHSGGTLEAGIMTNPLFDSTFTPLVTSYGTSDNYVLFEFVTDTFNHYNNYYVAFRYSAPFNYIYIDDINIRQADGCLTPTNLTVNPTATNTTLTWHDGTNTFDFVVEYRETNGSWSAPDEVFDTTYILTNLNSSTSYEVRVGLLCNGDTLWVNANFQTPCGLMSVPYFEDFDAYANDVMPPCWGWSSTSATHWDGGVFLRSYHGGGSEYVVVPELDGNITKLKIEFDTKVGTIAENDGILIGVANSAGTLLAWLDTIQDPNFSRNQHVHKIVYFTNYNIPANATRVAFAQYRNWNEWALIDNISIEELPDCYPVDNLTGHNLSDPENTTFTWTPMGYATQWQVYVDTVTVDIDSVPVSNYITVNDTSYTIPIGMIQGGGIYNFFVRSNCGNDQSTWVKYEFGAGTIIMNNSTVADTVVGCGFVVYDNGGPIAGYLPNSNSALVLRTENVGSQLQIFGGKFGFGSVQATLTVYDGEGTNGTVLYTYNTVDGRDTLLNTILAVSTTGSLTITFSAPTTMCHTGYELYIRCTDGAVCPRPTELQAQMTSVSTADATWNGTSPNYNFYYRLHNATAWILIPTSTNSVSLTGLMADTLYDMYVVAICSATDSSSASAIRQLNTQYGDPIPPCNAPTNLTVSNITINSAVIGWTAGGTESNWRVELNGSLISTNTNPCTLSGLNAGTTYTVKVQAICDANSESVWSDELVFTTQEVDTSAVYYTVSVTSSNTAWGTVTGGGSYEENSTVTITATANTGYHFTEWNDGDTNAVRTIVVTGNMNFVAYFDQNIGIDGVDGNAITLYPNPANSTVTISGMEPQSQIAIVDMNGREVYKLHTTNAQHTIDISQFAKGAYFVRITGERTNVIRKLVVK